MKKNSYLYNRPVFGTAPNRIEPEDQTNEYTWSKTFGNCALCGGDLGTVHVLMKPEHLFVCNPCSDRKRQRTVSEYRSTVFGWGSVRLNIKNKPTT